MPRPRIGQKVLPAPAILPASFLAGFLERHRGDPWYVADPYSYEKWRLGRAMEVTPDGMTVNEAMALDPIPPWLSGYQARAGDLYNRYLDEVEVEEAAGTLGYERVLSHRDFGLALQGAGYKSLHDEAGWYYPGLTVESRQERAAGEASAAAEVEVMGPIRDTARAEAKARHDATYTHVEIEKELMGGKVVMTEVEVACRHFGRTALGAFPRYAWEEEADELVEAARPDHEREIEAATQRIMQERYAPIL